MWTVHVNGRPGRTLNQITRHVAWLMGGAYTLKDWFNGKSEKLFFVMQLTWYVHASKEPRLPVTDVLLRKFTPGQTGILYSYEWGPNASILPPHVTKIGNLYTP